MFPTGSGRGIAVLREIEQGFRIEMIIQMHGEPIQGCLDRIVIMQA